MTHHPDSELIRPRRVVKNRSRFDIKWFWESGASLRWQSVPTRALRQSEMVEKLREIADTIEKHGGPTKPKTSA